MLEGGLGERGHLSMGFCEGGCHCNEACRLSLSCVHVCSDHSR